MSGCPGVFVVRRSAGGAVGSVDAAGSLAGVEDAAEHRGERLMAAMVFVGKPLLSAHWS